MELSDFGRRFVMNTGIKDLVDDLGEFALSDEKSYMLGGGNPALIPEVSAVWRERMEAIMAEPEGLERMLGYYDTSIGKVRFFEAMAEMLNRRFGWPVGPENIAVVNGSQTSCFLLFNMFSGSFLRSDGARKRGRILLPLMPEYIGYADQTIDPRGFLSFRPEIRMESETRFKYHVDFDRLDPRGVTALCASRPTNPTGNVLTDQEVTRLSDLAAELGIPFLIDNAYGTPFPNIIFEEVKPIWNENIVLSMSLSKIGLPAVRTGLIVASQEVIRAVSAMTAVASLAPGGVGQTIALPLLENGEILRISEEIVKPFYQERSRRTLAYLDECFGTDFPYAVHRSEGSIFLWIWFRDLPLTSRELYERLKKRRVIIVPGNYFFFGLDEDERPWPHRDQCIRINYAGPWEDVRRGLEIIAEEVRRL